MTRDTILGWVGAFGSTRVSTGGRDCPNEMNVRHDGQDEGMNMAYFDEMSAVRKAWESVGGALVMGSLTGALLGVHVWAYVGAILVSVVGGLPAGSQHRTPTGALIRGAVAGAVWAAALLTVHSLIGATSTIPLPEPVLLLVVISIVVTAGVAAASWQVGSRRVTASPSKVVS